MSVVQHHRWASRPSAGPPIPTSSREALLDDLGIAPQPWMSEAGCRGADPDLFFVERGGSSREARSVCRSCSVRAECLSWALDVEHGARYGILGGMSPRERDAEARRRRSL